VKYRLGYTWDQYREKIESGEWQLHKFPKGFLITEVVQWAEEKVLLVQLAGGEQFDAWKEEAQERLIKFGREQGCTALEAACRVGMFKKIKPLGWRLWHVIARKEI
jgi:hypothetical protein